jgi:hypothetical protein
MTHSAGSVTTKSIASIQIDARIKIDKVDNNCITANGS